MKSEDLLSITTHVEKEEPESAVKTTEENESDEPPTKKARVEIAEESKAEVQTETAVDNPEKNVESIEVVMKEAEAAIELTAKEEQGESKEEEVKKKKNRHHKKKTGQKVFIDEHVMAMKIMRKKEWKKLRNAYLNLERQKAKEIKKILRDSYNKRNNNKIQEVQKYSPANTASPRINFYGSPNDREDPAEATIEPESSLANGLAFTPGVIVNIKFREPCLDFKELKKEFKQYSYVAYVDILEGGAQSFIRVDNPSSAQELVNQYSSCEYETDILKDEAEKEYWKKIFEKRDSKKGGKEAPKKEPTVKRRRGREKLRDKISQAAQHIRFEENDEVVD